MPESLFLSHFLPAVNIITLYGILVPYIYLVYWIFDHLIDIETRHLKIYGYGCLSFVVCGDVLSSFFFYLIKEIREKEKEESTSPQMKTKIIAYCLLFVSTNHKKQ